MLDDGVVFSNPAVSSSSVEEIALIRTQLAGAALAFCVASYVACVSSRLYVDPVQPVSPYAGLLRMPWTAPWSTVARRDAEPSRRDRSCVPSACTSAAF